MLDWELAEFIGEELDDAIRERLSEMEERFGEEYEIVGGYEVLSQDPNSSSHPEGIDVYFQIKVKK